MKILKYRWASLVRWGRTKPRSNSSGELVILKPKVGTLIGEFNATDEDGDELIFL